MANQRLDEIKAYAALKLKRLDVNADGKIDAADAALVVQHAADDAAAFATAKPIAAVAWAFAAGVCITLFLVSIIR